ncbi:MAG: type II toxin-antitoxin system HicB family antitoxin [Deltaproteobacteria bacterium]|nr:type II toxin-antitoxin system HicB family antitoxin [Deltaproteobacteria bacterium]
MTQRELSYTVVFEQNENGGYTVTVPALPGLVTEGASIEEAKDMAREAITCYVEGLLMDGETIPIERLVIHETLRVAVG